MCTEWRVCLIESLVCYLASRQAIIGRRQQIYLLGQINEIPGHHMNIVKSYHL